MAPSTAGLSSIKAEKQGTNLPLQNRLLESPGTAQVTAAFVTFQCRGSPGHTADRLVCALLRLARLASQTSLPLQLWWSGDLQPRGTVGSMVKGEEAGFSHSGNISLSSAMTALWFYHESPWMVLLQNQLSFDIYPRAMAQDRGITLWSRTRIKLRSEKWCVITTSLKKVP